MKQVRLDFIFNMIRCGTSTCAGHGYTDGGGSGCGDGGYSSGDYANRDGGGYGGGYSRADAFCAGRGDEEWLLLTQSMAVT